ncbi:hypothetical protein [Pseudorhodoferax sp. Leaf274]|uniref:hypothetical protein n=1 Tax=Pseudorhodoferax sp. Leaf274 TaxID=1736318 RepID=UPI000703063E|nr:hypothetical protein [Pseudorhodoferax sp. Leaf274]KQP45484.1 hypothetical protein ASF44_25275 [Pseudorhodoferax sp. Leaf274]
MDGVTGTKASSTSRRGRWNCAAEIRAPSAYTMLSSSTPSSGSFIFEAICIAREVRPILWPTMRAPDLTLASAQSCCTA